MKKSLKKHPIIWLIFILLVLFLIFIISRPAIAPEGDKTSFSKDKRPNISRVLIGNQAIKVRLAFTEPERNQGLSGTKSLANDEGMLFIFDHPDFYGFWMKDMLYSLDIVWIDEKGTAVYMEKNLSPETFPKVFLPSQKALYALEVKSGITGSLGLKLGDKVEFLP